MLPCSLLAENIFSVFEVRTYPSIHNFELEASPCNAISEGRPSLCKTTQKRELCPQTYASTLRMTRVSDQKMFFWKPIFSTFYDTLFIISRKYFFGLSKSAPTPQHTILNSRLPPCNAISEGRPPFSSTSSEAGALPLEARIENF